MKKGVTGIYIEVHNGHNNEFTWSNMTGSFFCELGQLNYHLRLKINYMYGFDFASWVG